MYVTFQSKMKSMTYKIQIMREKIANVQCPGSNDYYVFFNQLLKVKEAHTEAEVPEVY